MMLSMLLVFTLLDICVQGVAGTSAIEAIRYAQLCFFRVAFSNLKLQALKYVVILVKDQCNPICHRASPGTKLNAGALTRGMIGAISTTAFKSGCRCPMSSPRKRLGWPLNSNLRSTKCPRVFRGWLLEPNDVPADKGWVFFLHARCQPLVDRPTCARQDRSAV